MLTRKVNNTISISSHIAIFMMKMYFAVLLAKFLWWLFMPAYNGVYIDRSRVNLKDTSIKYIINRYPFGEIIITEKKRDEAPPFSTLVKLHGVYVDGSDSMAFITYNDKSYAIKLNAEIASSRINVTKIMPDSIVVTQDKTDATIKMSKSNEVPNKINTKNNVFNNSRNSNMNQNNNLPNNQSDLMEKRKELIERFSQQELNSENGSAQATNPTNK